MALLMNEAAVARNEASDQPCAIRGFLRNSCYQRRLDDSEAVCMILGRSGWLKA